MRGAAPILFAAIAFGAPRALAEDAPAAPAVTHKPDDDLPGRLFLEGAVGPGFLYAVTDSSDDARTFTGGSVGVQAALGLTVTPGFVLGGALTWDEMFAMSVSDEVTDGDEPDIDDVGFALQRIGLFGDIFPDPKGGLHFQAILALGALDTRRPEGDTDDPGGLLLSLGGGYRWRVGGSGHLGGLLRASYGPFTTRETGSEDVDLRLLHVALLGTATFH